MSSLPAPQLLTLASASPRRFELLRLAGINPEVVVPDVDESMITALETDPHRLAMRLAEEKASVVSEMKADALVLAADTVVALFDEAKNAWIFFGKPDTPEDARKMISALQGRSHSVVTAYTLLRQTPFVRLSRAVTAEVFFRSMSEVEIAAYVACGEGVDKAGGYAVQGSAQVFIERLQGSYTCVMGLPLVEVIQDLESLGFWGPECLETYGNS